MKRPELSVEGGEFAGKRFSVSEAGLRLGRSSSNDIHIPDEQLSRNHCLFEPVGDAGIRLTDLASANGTFVNGVQLGNEAVDLKVGDVIVAGEARITVVDDTPVAPAVDLGLGGNTAAAPSAAPGQRHRSPLANVLWLVVVALFVAAIVLALKRDAASAGAPTPVPVAEEKPEVAELFYEKVQADSDSIFRYAMTLARDGTLQVVIDDVPRENRHLVKSVRLSETARATLNEILCDPTFLGLDRDYAGPESEPPKLGSWSLRVVYGHRARTIRVVNTPEPDAFRRAREKLEAFSMNELGIRALQYSRDKLVEMAAAAAETGRVKWEDRDVEYGNLFAAIAAYREAMADLETVNPKPPAFDGYREAKELAERELATRYADQRFRAEQAASTGDWERARTQLMILCQLVPDRDDERHREAAAKLMDVEKRLRKGGL